jgi:CspA family cold shock protein
MYNGIVKSFFGNRGFGFITLEDGTEVFAHFTQIQDQGFKSLTIGQQVQFDLYETAKGLEAKNICKL